MFIWWQLTCLVHTKQTKCVLFTIIIESAKYIEDITPRHENMNFIFQWQNLHFANESSEWVKHVLFCFVFFAHKDKIRIFKQPCNFFLIKAKWLFAKTTVEKPEKTSSISSPVKIRKVRNSGPRVPDVTSYEI